MPLRGFYVPHPQVYHPTGGELITKQEFKDECDINNILSTYKLTGMINHINNNKPLYTDLPDQTDYQQSLNTILTADTAFQALPSLVRDFFEGDPAKFLAAFSDPDMVPKLREFGLLNPLPPEPAPMLVRVQPEPEASPVPSKPS